MMPLPTASGRKRKQEPASGIGTPIPRPLRSTPWHALASSCSSCWPLCPATAAARNDAGNTPIAAPTLPAPPKVTFTDITAKAGIRFTHVNGAFGRKLMPESLSGGCAFFDYDGDGHPDLLLVNSRPWPGFAKGEPLPTMQLYRNNGDGTFTDVTAAVGLDVPLFGMGVAIGDFDNDGLCDLFVTALGDSRLFRNTRDKDGKHRFVDATPQAGDLRHSNNWPAATGDAFLGWDRPISFPSSAAFLDYDKDGRLDLFVCNYVVWSPRYDLAQGSTCRGWAGRTGRRRASTGRSACCSATRATARFAMSPGRPASRCSARSAGPSASRSA